jgi:hypothetical protein
MHDRSGSHYPTEQRAGVTDRDELLPLCLGERTGDFAGEYRRDDQFVDCVLKARAQL